MSRGFHSENAQGINSDVFKWEKICMYILCVYVMYDYVYKKIGRWPEYLV